MKNDERTFQEDKIEGRNAVLEALRSGREINKLFILKGELSGSIKQIIAIARERSVLIWTSTGRRSHLLERLRMWIT